MIPNPALLETLGSAAVAVVGSSIAAPVIATRRRMIANKERLVTLKLPSGRQVSLELDRRLSEEKVSELIAEAVRSVQIGDDDRVRRTIDASHTASQGARDAAMARPSTTDSDQPALS